MIKFQIIMPVFQTKPIFSLCIQSLLNTLEFQTELILINDGSDFNCKQYIIENYSIPDILKIHYIYHQLSIGCSKSINQGLELVSKNTYVIFADSDIIFTFGWQSIILNSLQDSTIGAVSGLLLYPQSGGIQCCGITYQNFSAKHIYLNNRPENLLLDSIYDVQASIFAFMAARSETIHVVGKIDEQFFNGYEDIDYQFRIRQNNYRIVINTALKLYHFEKSNGIHRNFSRRQNLGRFWAKHAVEVRDDFYHYLSAQLIQRQNSINSYILVNLCEAQSNAENTINFLKNFFDIKKVIDLSNFCCIERKIWLPEILSSDAYAITYPYIFLCDNFVELNENYYWCSLRLNYSKEDIIIDLHANILSFHQLLNSFWPGNKIR
ncbi:MAG: glycosyltransferase [bacterium]|nr:glycosyltransferase [bacterium]